MAECSLTNKAVVGSNPVSVTQTSNIANVLRKKLLDIQATIEYRFTLKRVCDMLRTDTQLFSINSKPMLDRHCK